MPVCGASSSTEKSSTEAVSSIVGDVPATNLCRYCFLADLTSAYEDRAYLVQLFLQLRRHVERCCGRHRFYPSAVEILESLVIFVMYDIRSLLARRIWLP